jgi:hypothetical protein
MCDFAIRTYLVVPALGVFSSPLVPMHALFRYTISTSLDYLSIAVVSTPKFAAASGRPWQIGLLMLSTTTSSLPNAQSHSSLCKLNSALRKLSLSIQHWTPIMNTAVA